MHMSFAFFFQGLAESVREEKHCHLSLHLPREWDTHWPLVGGQCQPVATHSGLHTRCVKEEEEEGGGRRRRRCMVVVGEERGGMSSHY